MQAASLRDNNYRTCSTLFRFPSGYDWKNDGEDPAENEHNFGTRGIRLETQAGLPRHPDFDAGTVRLPDPPASRYGKRERFPARSDECPGETKTRGHGLLIGPHAVTLDSKWKAAAVIREMANVPRRKLKTDNRCSNWMRLRNTYPFRARAGRQTITSICLPFLTHILWRRRRGCTQPAVASTGFGSACDRRPRARAIDRERFDRQNGLQRLGHLHRRHAGGLQLLRFFWTRTRFPPAAGGRCQRGIITSCGFPAPTKQPWM